MKKIIILIAMLCTFASANCRIGSSRVDFVSVYCNKNGYENFSIYMKQNGTLIEYTEEFNNKIINNTIYFDTATNSILCTKIDKDEYGVVIDKKTWLCKTTPVEKWNKFRTVYNF